MERIISDEEKIRRAIEISQRRNNNYRTITATRVNVNEKKNYKLFKKMILQIIICLLIYIIFYLISTTNYAFSTDVIKSTNEVLNYDINFLQVYENIIEVINSKIDKEQQLESNIVEANNTILQQNTVQTNEDIMGNNIVLEEKNAIIENELIEQEKNEEQDIENEEKQTEEVAKSQMELDAEEVGKLCKFKKPLSGTITSEFGEREIIANGMTSDHKGIDIAANSGTSIKAAMEGTVKVAQENSEYGKFIKIVNGDVMTVYAHCKSLKVKAGDKVKIGQTIATVGSTGVSTGPHLHFEIRLSGRYINPRLLINF